MFGSLVITLPSSFDGGELIVSHQGVEKEFKPQNPKETSSWVAFFADCKHEVKPITRGYRLAMVYNLVQIGNNKSNALPKPGSEDTALKATINCLKAWTESQTSSSKVHTLILNPVITTIVVLLRLWLLRVTFNTSLMKRR